MLEKIGVFVLAHDAHLIRDAMKQGPTLLSDFVPKPIDINSRRGRITGPIDLHTIGRANHLFRHLDPETIRITHCTGYRELLIAVRQLP